MLKVSYGGCLGLSPAISAQLTLEMRVAVQNSEKFTETTYFGGSRSFKVIDVDISLTVLVMISSMYLPVCNHCHVRRANSGRISCF